MVVAKAVFDKYLALYAEAGMIFNDVLMPRIQEICLHLHKFNPKSGKVSISGIYVSIENDRDYDTLYQIPIALLFDENWEKWVDDYLEKRRIRNEEDHRRFMEQMAREVETRERAELARLLQKYPNKATG